MICKVVQHISLVIVLSLVLGLFQSTAQTGLGLTRQPSKVIQQQSRIIAVRHGDKTVMTFMADLKGNLSSVSFLIPVPGPSNKVKVRLADTHLFQRLDSLTTIRFRMAADSDEPCRPLIARDTADDWDWEKMTGYEETPNDSLSKSNSMVSYKGIYLPHYFLSGAIRVEPLPYASSEKIMKKLTSLELKFDESLTEQVEAYLKRKYQFILVHVDQKRTTPKQIAYARPVQLEFNSKEWTIPITLGRSQVAERYETVIYAFSATGMVEAKNYRTELLASYQRFPPIVVNHLPAFYQAFWQQQYFRNHPNGTVYVEYFKDFSDQTYERTPHELTAPLSLLELEEMGVHWLQQEDQGLGYRGDLFLTRLHLNFDSRQFGTDVVLEESLPAEDFTTTYLIQSPTTAETDCPQGQAYRKRLERRKRLEWHTLQRLTGWNQSVFLN
jgi:hypothetical protein